jgi:hypothetical protein
MTPARHPWLVLTALVFSVALALTGALWASHALINRLFPDISTLRPDAHGMLHHPLYGTYPQEVPYHDGMDLLPGQSAIVTLHPRTRQPYPGERDGDLYLCPPGAEPDDREGD